MHHNNWGLAAGHDAVVDLYGENTDIHSNTQNGIIASGHGKVQIHLPSQHNTSHDNTGQDRTQNGGTITNVKWLKDRSSESGSRQGVVNM